MQGTQFDPGNPFHQGDPELCDFIAQRIDQAPWQRITFAEYMDWALYHPQYGYYSRSREKIGAKGDFFTSPHLASDFGELIAEQLAEMWQLLGRPNPFTLVEMGAGQGLLASDILHYLQHQYRNCYTALHYLMIEKATSHISEQRSRLQFWLDAGLHLEWKSLEEIPSGSITGCFFSNELADALPVHLVTLSDSPEAQKEQRLQEIYVSTRLTETGTNFIEVTSELSTPRLARYFDLVGIDFSDPNYRAGYRTEVNLAALDWISAVADRLDRGYVLTIDYGYPAARYYSPGRFQGTLQCYYRHSYHSDPYIYVGKQDITAHVDFTALQRQGEQCGLDTLGFTQQGLFLMALGLGDRLNQLVQTEVTNAQDLQNRLRHRDALHQLMNPMGLGGFGVLIQSKGLTEKRLKGLDLPTM